MCVDTQHSTASLQPDSGYLRACPGDSVEVNCTSTTLFLLWKLNIPGKNICEMKFFTPQTTEIFTLYGFSLTLLVNNGDEQLISSARIEDVGWGINGSVLTCSSTFAESPEANETASITILIEGVDGCSNVNFH